MSSKHLTAIARIVFGLTTAALLACLVWGWRLVATGAGIQALGLGTLSVLIAVVGATLMAHLEHRIERRQELRDWWPWRQEAD